MKLFILPFIIFYFIKIQTAQAETFLFLTHKQFAALKEAEQIKYIKKIQQAALTLVGEKKTEIKKQKNKWSLLLEEFSFLPAAAEVGPSRTISNDTSTELYKISSLFRFINGYSRAIDDFAKKGVELSATKTEVVETFWDCFERLKQVTQKSISSKYDRDMLTTNLEQLEEKFKTVVKINPAQQQRANEISDYITFMRSKSSGKKPPIYSNNNTRSQTNAIASLCNGFFDTSVSCNKNINQLYPSLKISDSTEINSTNFSCSTPLELCNPALFGYDLRENKPQPFCVSRPDTTQKCQELVAKSSHQNEILKNTINIWLNNPDAYTELRAGFINICNAPIQKTEELKKNCSLAIAQFNKTANRYIEDNKVQPTTATTVN